VRLKPDSRSYLLDWACKNLTTRITERISPNRYLKKLSHENWEIFRCYVTSRWRSESSLGNSPQQEQTSHGTVSSMRSEPMQYSEGERGNLINIKLPLYHKIRKLVMICLPRPGLIEDFFIKRKEEFPITCCICETYTWQKAKHIHKRKIHLLIREDVTWGLWPQGFICKKKEKKKNLGVSLKGLRVMNWFAANHQP
jgi:hypothetical protein